MPTPASSPVSPPPPRLGLPTTGPEPPRRSGRVTHPPDRLTADYLLTPQRRAALPGSAAYAAFPFPAQPIVPSFPPVVPDIGPDPLTYREAVTSPDSDMWQTAIQQEYDALTKRKTWERVPPPADRKTVRRKWGFKNKMNADRLVARLKNPPVAKLESSKRCRITVHFRLQERHCDPMSKRTEENAEPKSRSDNHHSQIVALKEHFLSIIPPEFVYFQLTIHCRRDRLDNTAFKADRIKDVIETIYKRINETFVHQKRYPQLP